MAYVDFPLNEQGLEFVALLNRSRIHAIARTKKLTVACDRPNGPPKKHVLDKVNAYFSPDDIDRIIVLLQSGPAAGSLPAPSSREDAS